LQGLADTLERTAMMQGGRIVHREAVQARLALTLAEQTMVKMARMLCEAEMRIP
jgi:hypothetical protein